MAFGQGTIEQLYRELAGGRQLSANLQALLEGPLDSRVQKEAVDVSRELGRVFMVSLYMLKPGSSSSIIPEEVARTTTPETRTDDSICLHTARKLKRTRSEEVPPRNGREEVKRTEVTPSPYKDGFLWRKYGQKNIQDSNYLRLYYKCTFSRERRCAAKKQVQQKDDGEPPMFLVTYLGEHTCQAQAQAVPGTPTTTAASSPPLTTTTSGRRQQSSSPAEILDSTMSGGASLFSRLLLPHAVGGGSAEEDAAIVTCLATVISGGGGAGAPPPLTPSPSWPTLAPEASGSSGGVPAAFVPSAGHSPSADGSVADEAAAAQMMDIDYCCFFQYDPSTLSPVEAAADHRLMIGDGDVPRAARITDTVWPRYTCDTSAWHR